jgi:enoyl-CoA hydratase
VEAGFATHFISRAGLPALRAALLEGDTGAIDRLAERAAPGELAALMPAIDRCFGAGSVPAILAALEAEDSDWAREQRAVLARVAPTSLLVTHEMLRRARDLDLPACLAMDTALARSMTAHPDFAEGVRALLVDKDNAPRWTPPTLAEAGAAGVDRFFG